MLAPANRSAAYLLLALVVSGARLAHGAPAADAGDTPVVVSGVIVLPGGEPAADVEVAVRHDGKPISARTNGAGEFSLEIPVNVARGGVLTARGPERAVGQMVLPWEADAFGKELKLLRIELKAPRLLQVNVVDANGKPAAGADVVATSGFQSVAAATADEAGRATLAVPQDAALQFVLATHAEGGVDYVLFRRAEAPVRDPYQLPPDHADPIALRLSPTRTVAVHVADQAGEPIAGATVTPWYIQLPKKGDHANLGSLWTRQTDAAGNASFATIPAANEGAITFWVRKKGLMAPQRTILERDATEDRLMATLLPLVPVSGRVVHADGSPAGGVAVRAAGAGHGDDHYRDEATSANDGTFQLEVYPDQYCLFAAGNESHASPAVARIVRLGQPIDDLELTLGPATRVFGQLTVGGEPAADAYVQLYQKESPDYYSLPESERLPNPAESRFAVTPRLAQSVQTDEAGRFKFHTGPGEFYLIANNVEHRPNFSIAGEAELEFNLAAKGSTKGKFAGRVVLASDPEQGVAELVVFSYPEDAVGRHLRATTDTEGRFEDLPPGSSSLVGAFNEEHQLGAIVRIDGDQRECVLALAPTATVRGTIIDEETGKPAEGREVGAAIRVGPKDGPFMSAFRRSAKSDANGAFEIVGLVPGHSYDVDVVTNHDSEGRASGWRNIGKAAPVEAGELALGELGLPAPYREPTVDDDIARAYSHKDPAARLKRLLGDAELAYQQVLIVAADPEGKTARQYFEICWHNPMRPNERKPSNLHEYLVLAVDPAKADDFFEDYNLAPPGARSLALAILNPDGSVVAQTTADDLSTNGQLDAKLLAEFLANRRAPLPSARRLLNDALAEAERDDKRVLVQVGGPGCGWCIVLARYLEDHKEVIGKDYIHLKIDSRMPAAKEVIGELREKQEGGIPWMTIPDADGATLITSDGEDGNIGYPGEPESRKHWEHMLRTTRQRLTDDDMAALLAPLAKSE